MADEPRNGDADTPRGEPRAEDGERRDDQKQSARIKRLLGDLLDSGQAIRRGSTDLVAGVASSTKEEVVRIFSAEVRNFLDKMDVVELAQEIVAGLVIDVRAEVRFSRDERGNVSAQTTRNVTKVRSRGEESDAELEDGDAGSGEEQEAPRRDKGRAERGRPGSETRGRVEADD